MTTPDPEVLGEDEFLISVRQPEAAPEKPEPFEAHMLGFWGGPDIQKVKITDEELELLRKQVQRIAGKLEGSAAGWEDERFAIDSVTLHVGITATGNFVLASAGVEVALDVTWRRPQPPQPPAP